MNNIQVILLFFNLSIFKFKFKGCNLFYNDEDN